VKKTLLFLIIGLTLCSVKIVQAKYAPIIDEIYQEISLELETINKLNPSSTATNELCKAEGLNKLNQFTKKNIQKITLVFNSFSEIFQNNCLQTDIAELEDLLNTIYLASEKAANNCNTDLIGRFEELYSSVEIDIELIRKFGNQPINESQPSLAKEIFFAKNFPKLREFQYYPNTYQTKLNRSYFSNAYLPYHQELNPQGCKNPQLEEIGAKIKKITTAWEELGKDFKSSTNGFMPSKRDISSAREQAKKNAKQYVSKIDNMIRSKLALSPIKFKFVVAGKGNQSAGNTKDMINNFMEALNGVKLGFINLGSNVVDTASWIVKEKNIEELQNKKKDTHNEKKDTGTGTTQENKLDKEESQNKKIYVHSDLITMQEKQLIKVSRSEEIAQMKAEYIIMYSEVSNQISKSIEYGLITTDACIQKSYTENNKGAKLGCFLDAEGIPVEPSGTKESLPTFIKELETYINKQCGKSMSKCVLEYN